MRTLLALLAANVNLLVGLVGFVLLYLGVAGLSVPVANIVAGSLLLIGSLWPYLQPKRKW